MTVKEARKSFVLAAEAYVEALKNSNDVDQMFGEALTGFIDGWINKECKFSYEENELYNMGYGQGENHLIP